MKKKVYVETSVLSLLVARRSNNIIIAARQVFTRAWWRVRDNYELYASQAVRGEAATGDKREVAKRLAVLSIMTPLHITAKAEDIARDLLQRGILPAKAHTDALHLATATVHNVEYLLSWNFKHLVNPFISRQIYLWAAEFKYNVPVVCTPEALLRLEYDK